MQADGIVVDHERAYIHWTNVDNGRGCVAITAAHAALRSFAYAITSARDEGDPQNTEKARSRRPAAPPMPTSRRQPSGLTA